MPIGLSMTYLEAKVNDLVIARNFEFVVYLVRQIDSYTGPPEDFKYCLWIRYSLSCLQTLTCLVPIISC